MNVCHALGINGLAALNRKYEEEEIKTQLKRVKKRKVTETENMTLIPWCSSIDLCFVRAQ